MLLGLGLWILPSGRLVTHHILDADTQAPAMLDLPELKLEFQALTQQQALQTQAPLTPPCQVPVLAAPEIRNAQRPMLHRDLTAINLGARLKPYFGTLHSHTGESDGRGTVAEAYRFAREVAHLDFFAITDHPEYWLFSKERRYEAQIQIAEAAARPDFVTLYGFEYSHPMYGHYTVLNTPKVHHAFEDYNLHDFYAWLKQPEQQSALVMFAHPGFHDYRIATEFDQFALDPELVQRFVGVETIHWSEFLRYVRGYFGSIPYIDEANQLGWWLGAMGSQDVHYADWGTRDPTRVVMLMPELSRAELLKALKARHFYATTNRHIHFAVNAQLRDQSWAVMGDILNEANLPKDNITIKARYYDGDCAEQPYRMEAVLGGRVVASYDFPATGENQFPFAGEFTLQLPLNRDLMPRRFGLYFRLYQGRDRQTYSQSSPLFFDLRGS